MKQFEEYKEDALSILDVLRNTYAMDNNDQDAIYLESAILGMEEEYEVIQNGLLQAIEQELKWNKEHKGSYGFSDEYREGFIKGLEQAQILFNQIGGDE